MIIGEFQAAQEKILHYMKISEHAGVDFVENAPGYLLYAQWHHLQNSLDKFEMHHKQAMMIYDFCLNQSDLDDSFFLVNTKKLHPKASLELEMCTEVLVKRGIEQTAQGQVEEALEIFQKAIHFWKSKDAKKSGKLLSKIHFFE